MLKIKNLNKRFKEKIILNNFNLEASPGDVIFITGSSGSGKSTLFRILNGLISSDSGEISFLNIKITEENASSFFGLVFQNFSLFENLNIKENIKLALKLVKNKSEEESEDISKKLLNDFKIENLALDYPKNISGGQKQRVAIARTLAMDPKIICFDEPTSALDFNLINSLIEIITELSNLNKIILISSHDSEFIKQYSLIQNKIKFIKIN